MIFEIYLKNLRLTRIGTFGTAWFPLTKYAIEFRRRTMQKVRSYYLF